MLQSKFYNKILLIELEFRRTIESSVLIAISSSRRRLNSVTGKFLTFLMFLASFADRPAEKNACTSRERYTGSKEAMIPNREWIEKKQESADPATPSIS